jgi:hypothetical protein
MRPAYALHGLPDALAGGLAVWAHARKSPPSAAFITPIMAPNIAPNIAPPDAMPDGMSAVAPVATPDAMSAITAGVTALAVAIAWPTRPRLVRREADGLAQAIDEGRATLRSARDPWA